MKNIRIETPNGHMIIYADQFFPCSQARLNKLFKIIRESWKNDRQDLVHQFTEHFTERIADLKESKKICSEMYFKKMQEHADYRDMLESGKHPNGIPLTKEELKDFKKRASTAKISANSYAAEAKKKDREITALNKNLEMLGSLE